jgi:hypothetical protein
MTKIMSSSLRRSFVSEDSCAFIVCVRCELDRVSADRDGSIKASSCKQKHGRRCDYEARHQIAIQT